MPKRRIIDDEDDMPRRKRRRPAAKVVAIEEEPNLLVRVLLHSPKDTMASAVAFAAVVAIVTNALFLQAGHHPSPMFGGAVVADTKSETKSDVTISQPLPRPRPNEVETAAPLNPIDPKPMVAIPAPKPAPAPVAAPAPAAANTVRPPASVPHRDPLGDLINANHRVMAVQRVLTEYGYGQLKATGVAGTDTQTAIRKFEADRKHPQTGQISDWLLQEMAKLTGKAIN